MKKKQFIQYGSLVMFFLMMFTIAAHAQTVQLANIQGAWKNFFKEYKVILSGISGLGALTSILVFIYHFIQLGSVIDRPHERKEILAGLLWSGLCTAFLGGITIFFAIFMSVVLQPS